MSPLPVFMRANKPLPRAASIGDSEDEPLPELWLTLPEAAANFAGICLPELLIFELEQEPTHATSKVNIPNTNENKFVFIISFQNIAKKEL
jgi:hypothetical protein